MLPVLPGNRDHVRAVDRRANGITAPYSKKCREINRQYGGLTEGVVGRVERKVEAYGEFRGLVFVFFRGSQ